jgi:hypothetical protein
MTTRPVFTSVEAFLIAITPAARAAARRALAGLCLGADQTLPRRTAIAGYSQPRPGDPHPEHRTQTDGVPLSFGGPPGAHDAARAASHLAGPLPTRKPTLPVVADPSQVFGRPGAIIHAATSPLTAEPPGGQNAPTNPARGAIITASQEAQP